ncbi:MAG: aminotransferase class I/II-fold pyridoxal phosphate-dependent enzyme [Alphaproteobacteria bacterium]|nr:aminotransferase class I/II-fold pyridoxal phosphate-dependent enzyme [Alphaproteobacteria bacterium]
MHSILPEIATDARLTEFTCASTDSVMMAAEKCLDNRLGVCFVLDARQRLLGRLTLQQIRKSVVDGRAFSSLGAGHLVEDLPAAGSPDYGPATPVLGDDGRLVDVVVDRSRQPVQIAQPDLSHDELRAVVDALLSTWISSKGSYIEAFERDFASFNGIRHGIAVSNGTVALHLALVALGIGPGDEVIVPDLTFAATINAVLYCGATPVIIDVDAGTWTMSLAQVERACTERTRAVIPVHLYGRPAEIGPIAEFAKSRRIFVVEDCAEAHGATYAGRLVGQFSDIACFSFYGNKIVTTGEGGMCLTDSERLAATLLELRSHGMKSGGGYWHEVVGFNYRMTNLQAALGVMQLRRIDQTLRRNLGLQQLYREHLQDIPGVTFAPSLFSTCEPVVWLCCALVPGGKRTQLIDTARRADIELRPFFHRLSDMPPYRAYAQSCPEAARLARTGINLPTSSAVDPGVVAKVASVFKQVLSG